jgi:hypothetical protein
MRDFQFLVAYATKSVNIFEFELFFEQKILLSKRVISRKWTFFSLPNYITFQTSSQVHAYTSFWRLSHLVAFATFGWAVWAV